jgi:cyclic-di-GMP phosphodiesterase TipF (flagellum assembly factor)
VDLLDYDVRFGQGFLFAPPRPLRPETPPASGTGATNKAQELKAQELNAQELNAQELNGAARPAAVDAVAIDPPSRVTGSAALARRVAGPA